eukprot:6198718-Pleurochrysis_carterae.AAC.2
MLAYACVCAFLCRDAAAQARKSVLFQTALRDAHARKHVRAHLPQPQKQSHTSVIFLPRCSQERGSIFAGDAADVRPSLPLSHTPAVSSGYEHICARSQSIYTAFNNVKCAFWYQPCQRVSRCGQSHVHCFRGARAKQLQATGAAVAVAAADACAR